MTIESPGEKINECIIAALSLILITRVSKTDQRLEMHFGRLIDLEICQDSRTKGIAIGRQNSKQFKLFIFNPMAVLLKRFAG
jgi:hypothetical protein